MTAMAAGSHVLVMLWCTWPTNQNVIRADGHESSSTYRKAIVRARNNDGLLEGFLNISGQTSRMNRAGLLCPANIQQIDTNT